MELCLPKKCQPLYRQARYKVLYGGRGSAKSWSVARLLCSMAAGPRPLRILCCREYQNSIAESSKHLIESQIAMLGYETAYQPPTLQSVTSVNGSEFIFEGLHHNVQSIKSLEDVNICWIEQAETITKASLDVLIPTIRAPNSEIWITMNPELEIDETYQRFVLNPPPSAIVIRMDYSDNPWFPTVLEEERLLCLERDPEGYRNIWGGECRRSVEGAIYGDLLDKARTEGRICSVPMDHALPVHTGWDLGVLDPTSIWFFQVTRGGEIHFIDYYEDSDEQSRGELSSGLPHHARMLRHKGYTYGAHYAPHDIEARELGTGKSRVEVARSLGVQFTTVKRIAGRESREDEAGIAVVRDAFPRMWFDEVRCKLGLQMLSRYRRGFNKAVAEFMAFPVHDGASHCFTGDTEVLTSNGRCRIRDLPLTGKVLTPCGMRPYRNPRMTRKNAQLVAVTFADGLTVKCTPDHLFLTVSGWKSASSLSITSKILSFSIPSRNILRGICTAVSQALRTIREKGEMVTRQGAESFIGRYGRWLSGLSRGAVMYTTETAMLTTIGLEVGAKKNLVRLAVLRSGCLLKKTGPSRSIAIAHVWDLPIKRDVWCITVPEGEAFCLANGAIVHNCSDALRCAMVGYQEPRVIRQGPRQPLLPAGANAWMS